MFASLGVWLLIFAALLMVAAAILARRFRAQPGIQALNTLLWVVAVHSVLIVASLGATTFQTRLFWDQLTAIPASLIGPLVFIMVYSYTEPERPLRSHHILLLMIVPVMTVILALTSNYHQLFTYDCGLQVLGSTSRLHCRIGAWFWVHYVYTVLMVSIPTGYLLIKQRRDISRINKVVLVIGVMLTIAVATADYHQFWASRELNYTPLLMALVLLLFMWITLRDQMVAYYPLSRGGILESLDQIIFITNRHGLITYFNQLAGSTLGLSAKSLGLPAVQLDDQWSRLVVMYSDREVYQEEVSVEVGGREHIYELSLLLRYNALSRYTGKVYILRDITEHKRLESALRRSRQLLLEAQSVARLASFHWDVRSNELTWSDGIYSILELDKAEFSGNILSYMRSLVHPDDEAATEAALAKLRTTGAPLELTNRIVLPDGTQRRFYAKSRGVLFNSGGTPQSDEGIVQDITQQSEIESALLESEAKFRSLFEHSLLGIALVTDEGRFVDVNPAFARIVGWSKRELSIMHVSEINPKEWRQEGESMPDWMGKLGHTIETTLVHRSREQVPIELTTSRLPGDERLIVAMVQDISERKWLEQTEHESEERYRSLVLYSPDAILVYQDNVVTMANYASADLFGASSPEELVGKSIFGLIHGDYHELTRDRLHRLRESNVPLPPVRQRIVRLDDGEVDTELSAAPFSLDGKFAVHIIIRDITERLKTESALRESEERYRSLLQVMPVTLAVVVDSRVAYVNPTGLRLMGAKSEREVLGQSVESFIDPADLDDFRQLMRENATYADHDFPMETRLRRMDGSMLDVQTISSQITYEGRPGVQYIITDISRRKQAEEQLLRHLDRERTIVSLGRELATTLDLQRVYRIVGSRIDQLIDAPNVAIELFDPTRNVLTIAYIITEGEEIPVDNLPELPYEPDDPSNGRSQAILKRVPVVVNDLAARIEAGATTLVGSGHDPRCAIYIPMIAEGRVIGLIDLQSYRENAYSATDDVWLESVANLIGLAIQQARLSAEAQRTAVAEERNRLAGELHDAVSQTLFASNLAAESLTRVAAKNPERIGPSVARLQQLNRGALAEMRTLLMELRPATLLNTNLKVLLNQLGTAIASRINAEITMDLDDVPLLPPDVQVAMYRAVQEALNNVVKHSGAEHIRIDLHQTDGGVCVSVQDDGVGFDPTAISPEHQGLSIMHERAEKLSIELETESTPGQGTMVRAWWKLPENSPEAS